MDKKIILWIVAGILALVVLYFVFRSTGSVTAVQSSAGAAQSAASSYGGMVGGC